ncbi:MAG: 16S rRNA (uracil(1498)-N(3))-methyltransferase [Exilispira sp.]
MRLVFLCKSNKKDNLYFLSIEDSHHLIVNRFNKNERINAILEEHYGEFIVKKIYKKIVYGEFIEKGKIRQPEHCLSLIIGIPKDKALKPIIEKSAEIGVNCIYLVPTKFSDRKTLNENILKRLNKISIEGCKQSGNMFLPSIKYLTNFNSINEIFDLNHSVNILLDERSDKENDFFNLIKNFPIERFKNIFIFIGPEGGISEEEKKKLIEKKFISVSLGRNILRTETAAITSAFFWKTFQNSQI